MKKLKMVIVVLTATVTIFFSLQLANGEPILDEILDYLYGIDNLEWIENKFDQIWFNINGNAMAQAKFASFNHSLGYIDNYDDFYALFKAVGSGYEVSGAGKLPERAFLPSFHWGISAGSYLWSSKPIDNVDSEDHMETYFITGGKSAGNFVICWEDVRGLGDQDYNDLVVEVSNVYVNSICDQNTYHCYQRFDDTKSWNVAKAHCESYGGYIVTITSQDEQEFVLNNLVSDSPNDCWLGSTDSVEEGTWKWVTDEDWDYDNSASGEPDNCNDMEHYGVIDKQSGLWHDRAILNNGSCGCDCPDDFEPMSTICEWGDIAGDLNGDNKVNGEDYQELRKSLGKCQRDSGFNSKADFDEDGCVSYRDYHIWYSEYYLD